MAKVGLFQNVNLERFNSWRLQTIAHWLFIPENIPLLSAFVKESKLSDFLILGLGSNILLPDKPIEQPIIALHKGLSALQFIPEKQRFYVEAGVPCAKIARACAKIGFSDFSFFAGIPGTLGGALAMNAGAFGGETWNHISAVYMMDREGERHRFLPDAFDISYRSVSMKHHSFHDFPIFLGAELTPPTINCQNATLAIAQMLKKREATQPIGSFNCGSVFRNPYPQYAGALIEKAGLKGMRIGGAQVSHKHANFIENIGGASSHDLSHLILTVQERIFSEDGLWLYPEVQLFGFSQAEFYQCPNRLVG